MFGPVGESKFTESLQEILELIESLEQGDCLMSQASQYFAKQGAQQNRFRQLIEKRRSLEEQAYDLSQKADRTIFQRLDRINQLYEEERAEHSKKQKERVKFLNQIVLKIIQLCEDTSDSQTLVKSSKTLATLLLLSPGEGAKLNYIHQRFKPLYRAVLSVRLLDHLLKIDFIEDPYIKKHYDAAERFPEKSGKLSVFQKEVVAPLIIASLFQDVGMLHPDAIGILRGPSGTEDEFRLLETDDRLKLLKINHLKSLEYISDGLGYASYQGEASEAKQDKYDFVKKLLSEAIKPKEGIGNLLKAPQIYSSVIMSTKPNFDFRELPKAAVLLEQVCKNGAISETVANSLIEIVGYFPQGFGIAYLPPNVENLDYYEYAIVNSLYPENPREPICRAVTRCLKYTASGNNLLISPNKNLFFASSREKLKQVSEVRLKEIISALYHDFGQKDEQDLIPKCWHAYDYFSFQKNQNLWNKRLLEHV